MKQWFTPDEIVAARSPALPGTVRSLNRVIEREGWRRGEMARKRSERGGGWEYHASLLPGDTQARLAVIYGNGGGRHGGNDGGKPAGDKPGQASDREALWAGYEQLSKAQKAVCESRLKTLRRIEELCVGGMGDTAAAAAAAREAGVSAATVHNWRASVAGVGRGDWLAALAPGHKGKREHAPCHERAWAVIKADWLRPEAPGFSACFRRMTAIAKREGWAPIPSERSLRRRMDTEVSHGVQVLARQGREAAKKLYPAQRRDRSMFHAMEAVNMDGHRLDVFVDIGAKKPVRMYLVGIQDLYSGKILAWRLAESEHQDVVRRVVGDMVERYGIPEHISLDNGRAFAAKPISGGAPNRYRFTVSEDEQRGLLTLLNVKIHWTKPYSGQSKPIERAWKDLAEEISKHPLCAGAYTGNSPAAKPENYGSKAVPLDVLQALCADRVAEHNARGGRRADNCKGRSFDEAFSASLAEPGTVVRVPTAAQHAFWMLAARRVRARKGSGEIHLFENRYWAPAMSAWAGRDVTVRYDPDRLKAGMKVYDGEDRLICEALTIDASGYGDTAEGRAHAKRFNAWNKAVREQQRLAVEMSISELGRLNAVAETPAPKPERPAVTRIARGGALPKPEDEPAVWDEEDTARLSRAVAGMRVVGGTDFD